MPLSKGGGAADVPTVGRTVDPTLRNAPHTDNHHLATTSSEAVPYACCRGQSTSASEAAPAVARSGYRAAAVGGQVWHCHPGSRLYGVRGVGRGRRGAGAHRLVAVLQPRVLVR